jgi:thioredoxin 1
MTLKLLLFTSRGCAECDRQRAVVDEVKREARGDVDFREVEMESGADAVEHYRVREHPCTVLERNGRELKRWVGVTGKEEILDTIREHRDEAAPRPMELPSGPATPTPGRAPPGQPTQPMPVPPGEPGPPPPQ